MQFIHQTHYGHVGALHTAKPIMAMDKGHIYEMKNGRPDTHAIYAVRDNKVYTTSFHPHGESPHAVYEIHGDKIHTTMNHPHHDPNSPAFEIKSLM
jgi:1,2-phenylacetyl-CoA epoxidase PaaB subunit